MKLLFFDVETTGLYPGWHGIHQLAGEIVIDGVLIHSFDYRMNPFKGFQIDNKALEISNTTRLDIFNYPKEEEAFFNFKCMLDNYANIGSRFFIAGWRVPEFDVKFLQALFERNNSLKDFKSLFWDNPIDVKVLATQYLLNKRAEMESFSLAPVAKYLGIDVDESKLHTAAYDAYLSRKVYEKVK